MHGLEFGIGKNTTRDSLAHGIRPRSLATTSFEPLHLGQAIKEPSVQFSHLGKVLGQSR